MNKKYQEVSYIVVCSMIGVLALGAGLTKAGYLPNVFNIGILCSENSSSRNVQIPHSNTPVYKTGEINVDGAKPVIYLYPQQKEQVQVKLFYSGTIVADYPAYDPQLSGWLVQASPDGTLINMKDKKEYSYLFWEGVADKKIDWNLSVGFVVKGDDTKEFLQNKLAELGLTPREYNEFIVYRYPKLQHNPYNLIRFAQEQYTDMAPLAITPKPDSLLRVFMVYKPLLKQISIQEQHLDHFVRKGFSVIERGGTLAQ